MVAKYLRWGMAAGLLAGLLAGLFAFLLGEPSVDQAIQIEEATTSGAHVDLFSRSTQKIGLFFATGVSGVAIGGLFGLIFVYFRTRLMAKSDWARSLYLAAALFAGASFIPFLKYPANPPTVGDPTTIRERTAAYLVMVALSLLTVLGAWYVARIFRERGVSTPLRQVLVGLGVVIVVGALFLLLPPSTDPESFPAGLLWQFRLTSLGTLAVLWTVLGVVFGARCERDNREERDREVPSSW